jgi:hypothetical protein
MCYNREILTGTPEEAYAAYQRNPNNKYTRQAYLSVGQPRLYSSDPNAPVPGDPLPAPAGSQAAPLPPIDLFQRTRAPTAAATSPSPMANRGSISSLFQARAPGASVRSVG